MDAEMLDHILVSLREYKARLEEDKRRLDEKIFDLTLVLIGGGLST